jgi:hypothetical protein
MEHRTILARGLELPMRLVGFDAGWLVSVDLPSGPTLGADRSPYLAAWRALEPLGLDLPDAIAVVGRGLARR